MERLVISRLIVKKRKNGVLLGLLGGKGKLELHAFVVTHIPTTNTTALAFSLSLETGNQTHSSCWYQFWQRVPSEMKHLTTLSKFH